MCAVLHTSMEFTLLFIYITILCNTTQEHKCLLKKRLFACIRRNKSSSFSFLVCTKKLFKCPMRLKLVFKHVLSLRKSTISQFIISGKIGILLIWCIFILYCMQSQQPALKDVENSLKSKCSTRNYKNTILENMSYLPI